MTETKHELSETSYAFLGLLDLFEPATPYQLKQVAQVSLFRFWAIPHTQLYREGTRLAEAGLVDEQREQGGRRRRIYRLTAAGRRALRSWRADPTAGDTEIKKPSAVKLFCGADPGPLAAEELERQRRRLHSFEELRDAAPTEGVRLVIELGIAHQRAEVEFWSKLTKGEPPG